MRLKLRGDGLHLIDLAGFEDSTEHVKARRALRSREAAESELAVSVAVNGVETGGDDTRPVAHSSREGLHDLLGNVWEWTSTPALDPETADRRRVLVSGSFEQTSPDLRPSIEPR